jgi:predicted nucleic acid-binding protein
MSMLLDTGILLRLADGSDAKHLAIRAAVRSLVSRGDSLFITSQNLAEYWNVATRPTDNNGLGLPPAIVARLFDDEVAMICTMLTERESTPSELRRLLDQYDVVGKQVHDARLVAVMLSWQVESILTLNPRNFRRFEAEGISVVEPAAIAG